MKRSHVSSGSLGTLSMSEAEVKRMSCLAEGWNLWYQSFFLVSFSLWKTRVSVWVVWRSSIASAWREIDAFRRLKMSSGPPWGGGAWKVTSGGMAVFVE